jgi:hypothetical protein
LNVSDEQRITPTTKAEAPSFEFAPEELEAFRGTGYELIPLHAPDALDKRGRPIGKAPVGRWRIDTPLDVDEAKQHLAEGRNVGVRLRETDLVVDVDRRHFKEGDDPVERLQKDLGIGLFDWPHVVTGSGGDHFYLTIPTGFAVSDTVEAYPGIEFKAHGRQIVAPGSSHPATGKPYLRDDIADVPFAAATAAPDKLLELIRRPKRPSAAEAGDYSPEQIELLLGGLDPAEYREHGRWLELMMACHHASAGEAREEFIAWSTSDPQYANDAWTIGRRWDSLHADGVGKRVTVKTLFRALINAGNGQLVDEVNRSDPADDFPDDLGDLPDFIGEQQPRDTLLDRINAGRFTVLSGGKYLVGREYLDDRMERHVVEWFPDEAVRKHMNIRSIETPDGKQKGLGDWWLKHPERRQYDRVIFDPSPTATPPEVYNLWRGWAVEPKKGDWSLLKRLVRDVLCRGDQASFDYVMRWAAFMVQQPSNPAEVALVFKGAKGVGKGTFGRQLKSLAGQHGRQVAQPEHFTGRFNEHLADTILLFVDEGLWAGDKKIEGALKNLITEPTLTFEGKNKPIIEGPNHLHVVIASNEDWVIPATPDERRFAVFEADADAKAKLPASFFEDLNEQMRNGGRAGMLHDLLAMDLDGWHPRKDIPQTEALAAQKVEGFRSDPLAFWWYRCLENGRIGYMGEPDAWTEPFEADSMVKEDMVDGANAQARAMGKRAEITKTKVARFLGKVGVDVGARNRKGAKVYAVPNLQDARKAFEVWVGAPLDWPD